MISCQRFLEPLRPIPYFLLGWAAVTEILVSMLVAT